MRRIWPSDAAFCVGWSEGPSPEDGTFVIAKTFLIAQKQLEEVAKTAAQGGKNTMGIEEPL